MRVNKHALVLSKLRFIRSLFPIPLPPSQTLNPILFSNLSPRSSSDQRLISRTSPWISSVSSSWSSLFTRLIPIRQRLRLGEFGRQLKMQLPEAPAPMSHSPQRCRRRIKRQILPHLDMSSNGIYGTMPNQIADLGNLREFRCEL